MDSAQKSLKKAQDYGYEFNDDLMNALPSVAPDSAVIRNPAAKSGSEVVRRAHDDAMKVLQTH